MLFDDRGAGTRQDLLSYNQEMSASAWAVLTQRVDASLDKRLVRPHAAAQHRKHSTDHSGGYRLRAQAHRHTCCSISAACLERTVCAGSL